MKENINTNVLEHTFTNDALFKILFTRNPCLLKKLVAAMLGIDSNSIKRLKVINSEISAELLTGKFVRLDINMDIDGQRVNLEIQVKKGPLRERSLYYWARNFSTALKKKGKYDTLPRTISLNILEEPIFECGEYYSEFLLLETTRNELLTDKLLLKYYELEKVPDIIDVNNPLERWLKLFGAKTEDELIIIERMGVPEMSDAIKDYRDIVVSEEFNELQRLREKAEHDEAQAIADAVADAVEQEKKNTARKLKQAKIEIVRNLLTINIPINQIVKATGLSQEEVKKLASFDS